MKTTATVAFKKMDDSAKFGGWVRYEGKGLSRLATFVADEGDLSPAVPITYRPCADCALCNATLSHSAARCTAR